MSCLAEKALALLARMEQMAAKLDAAQHDRFLEAVVDGRKLVAEFRKERGQLEKQIDELEANVVHAEDDLAAAERQLAETEAELKQLRTAMATGDEPPSIDFELWRLKRSLDPYGLHARKEASTCRA